MPLNLSFTHLMVVLIVALIVLGPDKLPEAARTAAHWVGQLRDLSAGLQAEVRDTFGEFAEPFSDLVHTVTGGVASATSGRPDALAPTESVPAPPPEPASAEPLGSAPIAAVGGPLTGPSPFGPLAPSIPSLGPSTPFVAAGPPLPSVPNLAGAAPVPGTFSLSPEAADEAARAGEAAVAGQGANQSSAPAAGS